MRDAGADALQYGSGQGIPALREQILDVMALEGIHGSVDNVVTATGSQQALDLVAKLFIDPGDVDPRRVAELRRRPRRLPVVPGERRARRDGRATG